MREHKIENTPSMTRKKNLENTLGQEMKSLPIFLLFTEL